MCVFAFVFLCVCIHVCDVARACAHSLACQRVLAFVRLRIQVHILACALCACTCMCLRMPVCACGCLCCLCAHVYPVCARVMVAGAAELRLGGGMERDGTARGGRRTILLSAGHPLNFNFGNLGQPRSSEINTLEHYRYHLGEQKTVFKRGDIKLVQYVEVIFAHV